VSTPDATPCPSSDAAPTLGHPVLDDHLRFVAARVRPNTVLATAFDLKVFFAVVTRERDQVTTRDVLAFVEGQCQPRIGGNVRIDDGEQGLSARTIKRRLSSVARLFSFLVALRDVNSNPVPREVSTRRPNAVGAADPSSSRVAADPGAG
jgi:integrase/recombinase XerD